MFAEVLTVNVCVVQWGAEAVWKLTNSYPLSHVVCCISNACCNDR